MQFQIAVILIASSVLIGYLGRGKALRFWGHFLLSLLLSPIIALLALGLEEWIENRKQPVSA